MRKILIISLSLLFINSLFGVNDIIYSEGSSSAETLSLLLSSGNRHLGEEFVLEFATIYIRESKKEGINWDIAFAQMCHETGYLTYGGLVVHTQNNFCGLGSFDGNRGASFSTITQGIIAHIQHLKAYSTTAPLVGTLIDPRYTLVTKGIAPRLQDLTGRWATDKKYDKKIMAKLKKLDYINNPNQFLIADVPENTPARGELELPPLPINGWKE